MEEISNNHIENITRDQEIYFSSGKTKSLKFRIENLKKFYSAPLVGAISSGCCSVLKPSPYTPNVSKVMEDMIRDIFAEEYVTIVQGGRKVNEMLFEQRFDMIFFTGSPAVGKVVMKAAAKNLVPVVFELGGKSPCIVDYDADLDIAARRIVWGKTINAGQTCIAPDFLLAHESIIR